MKQLIGIVLVLLLVGCQSLHKDEALATKIEVEQLLAKGEKAYRTGQMDLAEELFLRVESLDPSDEQALYRLGNIYFLRNDLKASARYFSRVVVVNPKNAKAHYNLGTIHLMYAEEHMKYFTATAPSDLDISNVSELLGDLAEFASKGKQSKHQGSSASQRLDKLVNLIEKK